MEPVPTPVAALVVVVALRTGDGCTVTRQRLCWDVMPSVAEFLGEVAHRRRQAIRAGMTLYLEEVPPDAALVLDLAGLSGELSG